MKALLDPSKFVNVASSGLKAGVVVTFNLSSEGEKTHLVVGVCACTEREKVIPELEVQGLPSPNWKASVNSVLRHYPANCRAAGLWMSLEGCGDEQKEAESIINVMMAETDLKDVFRSPPILVLLGVGDAMGTYQLDTANPELSPIECIKPSSLASVSRYLSQHTTMVRLCGSFPLYITTTTSPPNDYNVEDQVSSLVERIQSSSTVFLISDSIIFDETSNASIRAVLPEISKAASRQHFHTEHMAHTHGRPVTINLLESTQQSSDTPSAPFLQVGPPLASGCVRMTMPIDVLGLVEWESTLGQLASGLKERICAQIDALKAEILWEADTLHSVTVHHFLLDHQDCPVTVVYPDMPLTQGEQGEGEVRIVKSLDNEQLKPRRSFWKTFFGLPKRGSHLRVLSRRVVGASDTNWIASKNVHFRGPHLLNPHHSLKHTRVKGGSLALVQGNYLYYHYNQDGFKDETLWSWFLLQRYTDKKVPDHKLIQETLVAIGDKEKTFLHSKEWIGSCEVQFVLNQLLGIESKLEHSIKGGDMGSSGRVLLHHFQTEGTPVMIGGGILAHTIIGVDFNMVTGETQFLVLDPHYTGRDDVKTVLDKGWCGWKQVSFWSKGSKYNMCLPKLPCDQINAPET